MNILRFLLIPSILLTLLFSGVGYAARSIGQGQPPRVIAFAADVPYQSPLDDIWLMDIYNQRKHRVIRASDLANISWSPDFTRIAFIQFIARQPHLAVINVGGGGYQALLQAPFTTPIWSPDGEWLAMGSRSSFSDYPGIHIIRPDGTDLRQIRREGSDPVWSANGKLLYFLDIDPPGYAVKAISVEIGHEETLHRISNPFIEDLSWSPDRRWFAYVVRSNNNHSLYLWDSYSDQLHTLDTITRPIVIVGWSQDNQYLTYSHSVSSPLLTVSMETLEATQEIDVTYYRGQVTWNGITDDFVFSAWIDNPARYEIFHYVGNEDYERLTDSEGHKWDVIWWNP